MQLFEKKNRFTVEEFRWNSFEFIWNFLL